MAKQRGTGVLDALAGKKIVFDGKFEWGVEDALKAMARAQRGKVADDLNDSVDVLVVADLGGSKTVQKKALALNGKGASIQVMDGDAFRKVAEPSEQGILELIQAGESKTLQDIFHGSPYHFGTKAKAKRTFVSEKLDGVKLGNVQFEEIAFRQCSFVGAELKGLSFIDVSECDFSGARGEQVRFGEVTGARFRKVDLKRAQFEGDVSGADFSGATMEGAAFDEGYMTARGKKPMAGVLFREAALRSASFENIRLKAPDFNGADLTGARFEQSVLEAATFRGATLRNAILVNAKLVGADFSSADLGGANFAGADLTDARFADADLTNANLRGAKLDGVDLEKAKNYNPDAVTTGSTGPALKELDSVNKKAKRIQINFRVRSGATGEGDEVGVDSNGLQYGWGLRLPDALGSRYGHRLTSKLMSAAILSLASLVGNRQVRFETVEVSSTKSPKGGKELKQLVIEAISEAFAQKVPDEEELASATKAYREAESEKGAAERERRAKEKEKAEKQKEKEKKQIAKKIEKAVGKVSDVATFLKALEVRIEKPKIDKATKMLKASGFKLFNDVTDQHVSGVVKSQTDPDLVYACRIDQEGQYACCTQNLNICGGLRGSPCKHLLVLIIGLSQAGELDPTTIDGWLAKSIDTKPELDKEIMGAIFLKYKGAEAGEVDWRPTETMPEDYYSL